MRTIRSVISLAAVCVSLAGCGQQQGVAPASQTATVTQRSLPAAAQDARRAEFLNRIRAADPQYRTIERALLNERHELGIVLKRDVDLNDIPRLMRSLLPQMAKEFPGEDLTVIAYAPTNPPQPIGTGRLNASTREMTYTPAQPHRQASGRP